MVVLSTPVGEIRLFPVDPVHTRLLLPDGHEHLLPKSLEHESYDVVLLTVILGRLYNVKVTSFSFHERTLLRIVQELDPELTSDNPLDSVNFTILSHVLLDLDSTFTIGPATHETLMALLSEAEQYCERNLRDCLEDPDGTGTKLVVERALDIFKKNIARYYDESIAEALLRITGPVLGDETAFNRKEHVLRVFSSPELLVKELNHLLAQFSCLFRFEDAVYEDDDVILNAVFVIRDGSVYRTSHYTLTLKKSVLARHLYRMLPDSVFDEERHRYEVLTAIRKMLMENGFMVEVDSVIDVLVFDSKIAVCKPMLGFENCHVFENYEELKKYLYLGVSEPIIPTREFLEHAGDFIPEDEKRRLLETGCFNCDEPGRHGNILVSGLNNVYVISVPRGDRRVYIKAYGEKELAHYLSKLLRSEEKRQSWTGMRA